MSKENTAKLIRILTVPPVMVSVMLFILYFNKRELFGGLSEMMIMLVLLGMIPVLAYPVQKIAPKLREQGRAGQRKLAFIMNMIGYTAAFVWGIVSKVNSGILLVCSTYFLSVVMLAVCNLMRFKASGHACSVTGAASDTGVFHGKKICHPDRDHGVRNNMVFTGFKKAYSDTAFKWNRRLYCGIFCIHRHQHHGLRMQ
ncbi:MAG: hypothetical protein K5877_10380 [Lachnospiraceae bacterium]|nr:hypothetical protein [Lachnospiraceae bacterium]